MKSFNFFLITSFLLTACAASPVKTDTPPIEITATSSAPTEKPATPTKEPTAAPTETPKPTIATEIPPFSTVIPDTYEDFLAKVASGEIPTFSTQEAFDAHKAELAQTWLLTGEGNDIRPAEVFNRFDQQKLGKYVQFNFVNRINFLPRDIVVGPDGAEFVLAEIITPAGSHQVITIHATNTFNGDKNLVFSKLYNDLENGEAPRLFVFIEVGTPNVIDPLIVPMVENAPEDINDALWNFTFPENIADKVLVVTNVAPASYPENISPIFDK